LRKRISLARAAAGLGFVSGTVTAVVGLAIAIFVPLSGSYLAEGAEGLATGASAAGDAVRVLGGDFGSTSSLLGQVSGSVLQTSAIVEQIRLALGEARSSAADLIEASESAAGDLDALAAPMALLSPAVRPGEASMHLRAAAGAGWRTLGRIDSLSTELSGLEAMLDGVAFAVDSLGSDLSTSAGAMETASRRLSSIEDMAGLLSDETVVDLAGLLIGVAVFLTGAFQVFLAAALISLSRLRGGGETCPSPLEGCPQG